MPIAITTILSGEDICGVRRVEGSEINVSFVKADKDETKVDVDDVLVGTFTAVDGKVLINARIMDNTTGRVVASAKTYYKTSDCKILGNCPRIRTIRIIATK